MDCGLVTVYSEQRPAEPSEPIPSVCDAEHRASHVRPEGLRHLEQTQPRGWKCVLQLSLYE